MDLGDFAAKVQEAKALLKELNGTANIDVGSDLNKAQLAGVFTQAATLAGSFDGANIRIGFELNMISLAATMAQAAAATKLASGAGAAAGGAGGALFGNAFWGITATGLHWIIAGGAEILAVTVPAMIALGAAMAVAAEGAANVYLHMTALYTATEASRAMFGQTAGDVLGLGHALQTAQTAANPSIYGTLGSALEIVKGHMTNLITAGSQVIQMFQTFAAKVAVEFGPGGSLGGQMNSLLANMTRDLQGIGQLFGNLGHAVLAFASQMPGLAEILLGSLAGFAKLASTAIQFAGNFRIAGASILTVVMGFEEFNRWGGLMANVLTRMGIASASLTGGPFSFARMGSVIQGLLSVFPLLVANFAKLVSYVPGLGGLAKGLTGMSEGLAGAIESLTPFQGALIAAAAIGLGIFIDKLVTGRTATQEFTDSLQAAVMKASNVNAFQTIANNVQALNQRLAQTAPLLNSTAGTVESRLTGPIMVANGAIGQLSAGIKQQETDLTNVSTGAAYLAKTYGTTLVGGMLLADAANVKLASGITGTSQAAMIARAQIAALVQGYTAMGAPLSAVGSDILALGIQSGLAATKVSQLNQAWDQFMQNLTGGTSGLAGFVTGLANIGQVAGTTSNNLSTATGTMSLSTSQFARALTSFNVTGSSAWTNFDQVVGSTAPQLIDWMRTAGAEGALTGQQFSKGVLDMASALVPLAANSTTAQTEVLGLVHQVAPGITTWGQLTTAIKTNGSSLKGLGPIIDGATSAMGNMSKVAQALGTATDSALENILSTAKVTASGVGGAMQAYEQALMNGSTHTDSLRQAVLQDFEKMGYSAQQAEQIINAAIAGITPTKTITIQFQTTGTIPGLGLSNAGPRPTGYASGTPGAASGWAWVGEAGPELVRFRGGETVIPNQVATGYAGGAGDFTNHVHVHLDGRQIYSAMQKRSVTTQRRTGTNGMQKRTR